MSAPIVVIAVADVAFLLFKSSTSIALSSVVPVGEGEHLPAFQARSASGEAEPVGNADHPHIP